MFIPQHSIQMFQKITYLFIMESLFLLKTLLLYLKNNERFKLNIVEKDVNKI